MSGERQLDCNTASVCGAPPSKRQQSGTNGGNGQTKGATGVPTARAAARFGMTRRLQLLRRGRILDTEDTNVQCEPMRRKRGCRMGRVSGEATRPVKPRGATGARPLQRTSYQGVDAITAGGLRNPVHWRAPRHALPRTLLITRCPCPPSRRGSCARPPSKSVASRLHAYIRAPSNLREQLVPPQRRADGHGHE